MKKNCQQCNEPTTNLRFCSNQCKHKAKEGRKAPLNVCQHCAVEYPGKKKQKYCSEKCQHEASSKPKNPRITMVCDGCRKEFVTMEGWKSKRKKYCSRTCKDDHQKTKYLGDGNPMAGKEVSEATKELHSLAAKEMWADPNHKYKVQVGQRMFVAQSGHWMGTDEQSKLKRRQTFLAKYGVDHNWKDKTIRAKCDATSIERTGFTILQRFQQAAWKAGETKIEKVIKYLLKKNDVPFKRNYYIYFNEQEYKVYDFYLPLQNLLIEADGDYWHGNPERYDELNEMQSINKKNDAFKDELAKNEGMALLRFWESDINEAGFEDTLMKAIQAHGNR